MGGARVLTQVDDAGPEKLVSGPVHYFDGRHDNLESTRRASPSLARN
jgi:hypothetical protein